MALVSALALVCQQVLVEKDDVSSAIRMAEVFMLPEVALADPDKFPVPVVVYITIRVSEDDADSHAISLSIERPSGEVKDQSLIPSIIMTGKYPGTYRSINIAAHLQVRPSEMGVHTATVNMDGAQVAQTHFILTRQPQPESDGMPN